MSAQLHVHAKYYARAHAFAEKYELIDIFLPGDARYSKESLKPYQERTCRFCGLKMPEVSFTDLAHLVSKLIGNSNLYSDFECNDCNKRFSQCEGDLANFLGISRSITGLQGDKQTVGFVGKKLKAKSRSFVGDNILIIAPEDYMGNNAEGKGTITYIKNSFVPSKVYKALIKYAVSLLDEDEISKNYKRIIEYLNETLLLGSGAYITGFQLPFTCNLPLSIYLFRRKELGKNMHTHVFIFNFQNFIISLPLPLNGDDIQDQKQDFQIPVPPPYFHNLPQLINVDVLPFIRDLCSPVPIDNEEETITFTITLDALKNSAAYDPVTDQTIKTPHDPEGLKYLIIGKEGTSVDPKALSAFINEHMEKEKVK